MSVCMYRNLLFFRKIRTRPEVWRELRFGVRDQFPPERRRGLNLAQPRKSADDSYTELGGNPTAAMTTLLVTFNYIQNELADFNAGRSTNYNRRTADAQTSKLSHSRSAPAPAADSAYRATFGLGLQRDHRHAGLRQESRPRWAGPEPSTAQ